MLCSGQGGCDLLGNKRQIGEQELKLGNLALVSHSTGLMKTEAALFTIHTWAFLTPVTELQRDAVCSQLGKMQHLAKQGSSFQTDSDTQTGSRIIGQ